jgi:hypothetical protein
MSYLKTINQKVCRQGLPDGTYMYFLTKNPNLGIFLEGLGLENFGILYGTWIILRPFDIFYGHVTTPEQ